MPSLRSWILGSCATILAGCIADGQYVVKGHLRAADGPVEGAIVRVSGHGMNAGPAAACVTGTDGAFELQYRFGGIFPFWSDGSPRVEVEAAGFTPVAFPLRGSDQPGVVRRECEPRACFDLDVALRPLAKNDRS